MKDLSHESILAAVDALEVKLLAELDAILLTDLGG
jgi:hypothetical protein